MSVATTSQIVSSLPPGEEIFDIRPPVAIPYPWGTWLLYFITICVVLFLIKFVMTMIREREEKALNAPPPPPDPLEEALKAMRRLKTSSIWKNGAVKDICEVLALILREFLKAKYSLGLGKASTSDELVDELFQKKIANELVRKVENLSTVLDGVKYAGENLHGQTLEDLHQRVLDLINCREWEMKF
ncbi:MAG: hypothetical protein HQM08_10880 [Candidatus Riflebacteria bacterium]|nr:hypothetical protein [Candidatus Riflebacteria bacterium]